MTCTDMLNVIKDKVYRALEHGLGRDELTVLMPYKYYVELHKMAGGYFTVKDITVINDKVTTTKLIGVTLKPVKDLDEIYVCL